MTTGATHPDLAPAVSGAQPCGTPDGHRFRFATIDDNDAIAALEAATFPSDAWSSQMIREELTAAHRSYIVLVSADGTVQGYGGVLVLGDDADIQTLAVAAALRGRGHGRRLLHRLIDEARSRNAQRVFLEVRADNPVAHTLYTSAGFRDIALRRGYYQPGNVDAIVMQYEMENTR